MKKFAKHTALFFLPVLVGYFTVEYFTRQLPMGFNKVSEYYHENKQDFEVLVLGSSQMKDAVNPEWMNMPTLNMASGNQHHDTDFKILKTVVPQLPRLKTVVLEVSYSHLELPHNGKEFWKNGIYYTYYGVNAFERPAWFKDRLIYLSNPRFFSERLIGHYKKTDPPAGFSTYGFDTLNYGGLFQDLKYSEAAIETKQRFRINETENPVIFRKNTALLHEILEYLDDNGIQVVLCTAPMYKSYLPRRNSKITDRRDSVLTSIRWSKSHVRLLLKEEDTLLFKVTDFWNQSHLNPDGARKFTKELNDLLTSGR